MRAKKTYKGGDKVVAQGADRADLRAERKQARKTKRAETKRYTEKGTFDVGVDRESYPVEGKLVTKRKRGNSVVTKFKAKGAKTGPIKSIKDKKKVSYKSGEAIVKKDKRNTKYRSPKN